MAEPSSQISDSLFLQVPFDQRWPFLKPVIKSLYIDEDYALPKLVQKMKDDYKFNALEHQYKYHLRKWGLTKNISTEVKNEACKALGKRIRGEALMANVTYKGEKIDKKRLRRHINTQAKQEQALQLSNNVFLYWSLPYRALRASLRVAMDMPSPWGITGMTPEGISVIGYSPSGAPSPSNAPSPTAIAIRKKTVDDRAKLLIQGRHDDLLNSMTKADRKITTTWLHQFWLFAFKTVRHWGRGPRDWSAENLRLDRFSDPVTSANTPATTAETPGDQVMSDDGKFKHDLPAVSPLSPTPLCRWTIHAKSDLIYERLPSPDPESDDDVDPDDERSWTSWPKDQVTPSLLEKICIALQSNSFSNIKISDLPLSASQLIQAVQRSPTELLEEAVGFVIMARNEELLWDLVDDIEDAQLDFKKLFPLHLATSYLDGANFCCNVLNTIAVELLSPRQLQDLYVNDLRHTVLDNLMIAIFKAHTSCPPSTVDSKFSKDLRFAGEEVDICGRWGVESPCIRQLHADGTPTIPFEWKHMFCHTSAQVICHSIGTIFGMPSAPDINTPSGLFSKKCLSCGKVLTLLPLHTLVLTAFYLAQSGCDGENLFGILACLVCLLVNGANPLLRAHISTKAFTGSDNYYKCSHRDIDPIEFIDLIMEDFTPAWTPTVLLGWEVVSHVLRNSRDERLAVTSRSRPSRWMNRDISHDYDGFPRLFDYEYDNPTELGDDSEEEDDIYICEHSKLHNNHYDGSKDLGVLWAAIQTELLTYRRLSEGDEWMSTNFSMHSLLEGLRNGNGANQIPLVEREMMKPFCRCGRFLDASDEACVVVDEASSHYFCNLEDWDRSQFIVVPYSRMEVWYDK